MKNEEFRRKLITRAFILSRNIIKLVDRFPNKRSAWIIADQLIRAATSIGANIIEAQAAASKRDFLNFLNHALKSANETQFWLMLAKDLDNQLIDELDKLLNEVKELAKILGSSVATIRGKRLIKNFGL